MSEKIDTGALIRALNKALPLLVRDAAATALAAGTMPGTDGVALAPRLAEFAAAELADVERVAARIAAVGGAPSVTGKKLDPPKKAAATLEWLATMQREANNAVVAAIPADADDAEGEATEHLLEHIVARKREVIGAPRTRPPLKSDVGTTTRLKEARNDRAPGQPDRLDE